MTDQSRKEAMLTKKQREFLRGELEYESKQERYQMRERIRRRVRDSFIDFSLLLESLDEREQNHIFDPPTEDRTEFETGVGDTLGFIYLCTAKLREREREITRSSRVSFDTLLDRGLSRAEVKRRDETDALQWVVEVDFDVRVTDPATVDVSTIAEKLSQGKVNELSEREMAGYLQYFASLGTFTPGNIQETLREFNEDARRDLDDNDE